MTEHKSEKKRRRGHPGIGRVSAVRLPDKLFARVIKWAKQNRVKVRAEALRQLIEKGLDADGS
jgi:hypothetical protein